MQQLAATGTTVLLLIIALVAMGGAMVWLAVWLTRSTRTDAPALGPLEAMGARGFRRGGEATRTARLADARPDGAPAPAPIVAFEDAPVEEKADTERSEEHVAEPEAVAESEAVAEQEAGAEPLAGDAGESPEAPLDEAPEPAAPAEEPAPPPQGTAEVSTLVASILTAPSPLETETDEDEPVEPAAERLDVTRVEEAR